MQQVCLAAHFFFFLLGIRQESVVNLFIGRLFTDIEHTTLFLLLKSFLQLIFKEVKLSTT